MPTPLWLLTVTMVLAPRSTWPKPWNPLQTSSSAHMMNRKGHSIREPDVALCVVIDDETLEKAHQVQVRLEDVPTFVIDG